MEPVRVQPSYGFDYHHSDSDDTFFVPRPRRNTKARQNEIQKARQNDTQKPHQNEIKARQNELKPRQNDTQKARQNEIPGTMVLISTSSSRPWNDEFCDISLEPGENKNSPETSDKNEIIGRENSKIRRNLRSIVASKIKSGARKSSAESPSRYSDQNASNSDVGLVELPPFEVFCGLEHRSLSESSCEYVGVAGGRLRGSGVGESRPQVPQPPPVSPPSPPTALRAFSSLMYAADDTTYADSDTTVALSDTGRRRRTSSNTTTDDTSRKHSLVDGLLLSIYRHHRRRHSSQGESDTLTEHSTTSDSPIHVNRKCQQPSPTSRGFLRRFRLLSKDVCELRLLVSSLQTNMSSQCCLLVRELKKRDKLRHRRDTQNDLITAVLHALSQKRSQDTRMRFSVAPLPGDSGFTQWHDAMMMCARLPGGIPQEFRRRLWLTLAEKHLQARGVSWRHAESFCFNEWSNPDDDELGDQIVKDLHRTGCSLFCGEGEEAEDNQAMLKRVLLAFARWNKGVGYCQGFNMLAAIILEVMERRESDALKVMIYLIEGVLPESYFANNLRGLSVDMAVFRDLLRLRLPHLSRHLEHLQQDAADQATGTSYEPPLTNVFTMQWFLTLFSNCLPRETVMRVWDLTFLQGNEVLLRTALAIWDGLAGRILEVHSADEFYTVMGVLTREMLTFGLMDANKLVQKVVGMAPFPFPGLAELRDKYTYNITPWAQSVSSVAKRGLRLFYSDDDDDDNDEDDQKIAVATAFGLSGIFRKNMDSSRGPSPVGGGNVSPSGFPPLAFPSPRIHEGREGGLASTRPNLDISALKKQYARLRERQKQAHIILTASQQRVSSTLGSVGTGAAAVGQRSTALTMNHLLRGKKALTSKTKRVVPQGVIPTAKPKRKADRKLSDSTGMRSTPQTKPTPKQTTTESVGAGVGGIGGSNTLQSPLQTLRRAPPAMSQGLSRVETLHWKDTPRRDRRASLPSGVKLLEGASSQPHTPLGVPDEMDDEDGSSSTSTELCDDDGDDHDKLSDLEADIKETRPATTSPRLETVKEGRQKSPQPPPTPSPAPTPSPTPGTLTPIQKEQKESITQVPKDSPALDATQKDPNVTQKTQKDSSATQKDPSVTQKDPTITQKSQKDLSATQKDSTITQKESNVAQKISKPIQVKSDSVKIKTKENVKIKTENVKAKTENVKAKIENVKVKTKEKTRRKSGMIEPESDEPPSVETIVQNLKSLGSAIPLDDLLAKKDLTAAEIIARIPFPSDVSFMKEAAENADRNSIAPRPSSPFSTLHNVTPEISPLGSPVQRLSPELKDSAGTGTSRSPNTSPSKSLSLSSSPSPHDSPKVTKSPHDSPSKNQTNQTKTQDSIEKNPGVRLTLTGLPPVSPDFPDDPSFNPPKSPKITVEDERSNIFEIHAGRPGKSSQEESQENQRKDSLTVDGAKIDNGRTEHKVDVKNIDDSKIDAKKIDNEEPCIEIDVLIDDRKVIDEKIDDTKIIDVKIDVSIDNGKTDDEKTTKNLDGIKTDTKLMTELSEKVLIKKEIPEEVKINGFPSDIDVKNETIDSEQKIDSKPEEKIGLESEIKTPDKILSEIASDNCKELSKSVEHVSDNAEELSESVEPISDNIKELSESVEQVTDNDSKKSSKSVELVNPISDNAKISSESVELVNPISDTDDKRSAELVEQVSDNTKESSKSVESNSDNIKESSKSVESVDPISDTDGKKSPVSDKSEENGLQKSELDQICNDEPIENDLADETIRGALEFLCLIADMKRGERIHTDHTTNNSTDQGLQSERSAEELSAATSSAPFSTFLLSLSRGTEVSESTEVFESAEDATSSVIDRPNITSEGERSAIITSEGDNNAITSASEGNHDAITSIIFPIANKNIPQSPEVSDSSLIFSVADKNIPEVTNSSLIFSVAGNSATSPSSPVTSTAVTFSILKNKVGKCLSSDGISASLISSTVTSEIVKPETLESEILKPGTLKSLKPEVPVLKSEILKHDILKSLSSSENVKSELLSSLENEKEIDETEKVEHESENKSAVLPGVSAAQSLPSKLSLEERISAVLGLNTSEKPWLKYDKTSPLPGASAGENLLSLLSSMESRSEREESECEESSSQNPYHSLPSNIIEDITPSPLAALERESSLSASLEGRLSQFTSDEKEDIETSEDKDVDREISDDNEAEAETDYFNGKELSSEAIRQRLWRGVKSLSLDADVCIDPEVFCYLIEQSSKQCRKTSDRKTMPKRRNSEVALQELVKENTEIIERILRQKSVEGTLWRTRELPANMKNEESQTSPREPDMRDISVSAFVKSLTEKRENYDNQSKMKGVESELSGDVSCASGRLSGAAVNRLSDASEGSLASGAAENRLSGGSLASGTAVNRLSEASGESLASGTAVNRPSEVSGLSLASGTAVNRPSDASGTSSTSVAATSGSFEANRVPSEASNPQNSPEHRTTKLISPKTAKTFTPERKWGNRGEDSAQVNLSPTIQSQPVLSQTRPITFNPFPTRNIPRQPKEVGVKLGLYSTSKKSPSSPS